jgi:hypothetical protein
VCERVAKLMEPFGRVTENAKDVPSLPKREPFTRSEFR